MLLSIANELNRFELLSPSRKQLTGLQWRLRKRKCSARRKKGRTEILTGYRLRPTSSCPRKNENEANPKGDWPQQHRQQHCLLLPLPQPIPGVIEGGTKVDFILVKGAMGLYDGDPLPLPPPPLILLLRPLPSSPPIRPKISAEILGDPYRRQVPLPRITNNQAQDPTRDSAHPYVKTLGTYGQKKLGQRKPEQPFIQSQRRTDVIDNYTNIRT